MATKQQISRGISEYIVNEMVPRISDVPLKIMLSAIARSASSNTSMLDRIAFDNPIVSAMLNKNDDGEYDIACTLDSIKESMRKFGALTLTLPQIPLIAKTEKSLTFTPDDIECLMNYIDRGCYE